LQPLFHIVEGDLVSNIVHHNDTVCSTVVTGCNCTEAFLPSVALCR